MVDFTDMPLLSALKNKMKWLNANQSVLSENIAHANTPGYRAKELQEVDFSNLVEKLSGEVDGSLASVEAELNKAVQMNGGQSSMGASSYVVNEIKGNEESPNGNSVVLEEEMIKLADNQMQYDLASKLYKKNINLIKAALGKGSGG